MIRARDLRDDPAWFPHRFDWANRLIGFVRTRHHILANSAFLDGRTALTDASDAMTVIDLETFLALEIARPAMRWLFHGSFCGSTLLARILTVEGRSLCLREPQILVDLTNCRLAARAEDRPLIDAVTDAVVGMLARRWEGDERIAVKPSNWVTPILPSLWRAGRGDRAVFVRADAEPFLVAVLRGGRDRIAYTLQLHGQIVRARPDLARLCDALTKDAATPVGRALQLVAAVHWMQDRVFADALSPEAAPDSPLLFPALLDDLPGAIDAIRSRWRLPIPDDRLAAMLARERERHSKTDGERVDRQREAHANATLRREYRAEIAQALELIGALAEASRAGR